MDFQLVFLYILLFFLSWGLRGFSKETEQMDFSNNVADTLGESVAGTLRQVQENTDLATTKVAISQGGTSNDDTPCMQKLLPCEPFLHSPSPPSTCCTPLKDLISQDIQCLCKVFSNPELLKAFNITMDEALAIPKACGIEVDTSVCKNATSPGTSITTPSTPSQPGSTNSNSSDPSKRSNSNASVKINIAIGAFWFNIASNSVLMFSTLYI